MDDDTSYISLFAQEQRRRGLSVGTIRVRTGHLNAIKVALGSFDAVTRPKLNRWFTERGYIDSTKRGYIDTLSEFFKYGMQCHWFDEDPTVGITLPPVKPDRDAVSDQDVALLLKNATKLPLRCWLALIAFQGLRPQEVAELTSEDVDLRARPPKLNAGGNEIGVGKTAVVHPEVEGALRSLDLPDRGRLFPTANGANVGQQISRHFTSCGVPGSSTSLLWWYRLQVQHRGQNFDRLTGTETQTVSVQLATCFPDEIAKRIRHQLHIGDHQQAVFEAMRTVEVRVRKLAGLGDDLVGVALMSRAFNPDAGPLTDPSAVGGERVGTMNLFQGAYAVLRNPAGHREVVYDDVTEAAEAIGMANLLMRVLDRVEARLASVS
jgi:uncharacterized protein (TIGR02391 family)